MKHENETNTMRNTIDDIGEQMLAKPNTNTSTTCTCTCACVCVCVHGISPKKDVATHQENFYICAKSRIQNDSVKEVKVAVTKFYHIC